MTLDDDLHRLRGSVGDTRFRQVDWVAVTGSTNTDLLVRAADPTISDVVLVADEQTAGRGRRGRTWTAPAGASLLFSVLVRPLLDPDQLPLVTQATALAARDACSAVAGVDVGVKWPNDLVIETEGGTRKVAGLLAESRLGDGGVEAVVVGLGLNVNWPTELPADLVEVAVALNHVAGRSVDRVALLGALLVSLDRRLDALTSSDGRHSLRAAARQASATLGRRVVVDLDGAVLMGKAVDLLDSGELVVDVDGEGRRVVRVGDVHHLRVEGPPG